MFEKKCVGRSVGLLLALRAISRSAGFEQQRTRAEGRSDANHPLRTCGLAPSDLIQQKFGTN